MEPLAKIEREHYWVYDEEIPAGWRQGNLQFVPSKVSPGGVQHHMFIYDPKVKYEDRRPNGEDARWIVGQLHARSRIVVQHPWEDVEINEYLDSTHLFEEYRS